LPPSQEIAKQIFRSKHNNGERLFSSNFRFYSMRRILDIYFVGGFGTVQARWACSVCCCTAATPAGHR